MRVGPSPARASWANRPRRLSSTVTTPIPTAPAGCNARRWRRVVCPAGTASSGRCRRGTGAFTRVRAILGATIHFLAVLANLVQVAVEIGVVSCGAEPAHQWVFPRYVHVHERARVQLLPEQRA